MKEQSMGSLIDELRAVARGKVVAPADAAEPSVEAGRSTQRAADISRLAALDGLARQAQELKLGYEE